MYRHQAFILIKFTLRGKENAKLVNFSLEIELRVVEKTRKADLGTGVKIKIKLSIRKFQK